MINMAQALCKVLALNEQNRLDPVQLGRQEVNPKQSQVKMGCERGDHGVGKGAPWRVNEGSSQLAVGWHLDDVKKPQRDFRPGWGDLAALQMDWSRARTQAGRPAGKVLA